VLGLDSLPRQFFRFLTTLWCFAVHPRWSSGAHFMYTTGIHRAVADPWITSNKMQYEPFHERHSYICHFLAAVWVVVPTSATWYALDFWDKYISWVGDLSSPSHHPLLFYFFLFFVPVFKDLAKLNTYIIILLAIYVWTWLSFSDYGVFFYVK
jgi:hypothetical protein